MLQDVSRFDNHSCSRCYAAAVRSRLWYATIAVLVLAALVIQVMIAVQLSATPPSHGVGELRGGPLFTRLVRVFSFFTIQANILSMIVSAVLVRAPNRDGSAWRILCQSALIGITITGIVYSTVLARVHEPKGWEQVSTNTVFHYIIPIMMVIGWLVFGPRPRMTRSVVLAALIWPVLWLGYTLAHGAASRWYPYPFVDVTSHGYGRVAINSVLVCLVYLLVSALFAFADRKLPATDPRG
ncbi:MAG: hypothetical protein DLM58_17650 [Pseudonocardiales bacterium]|nr:MAG: hypothetical protein DLM58_17650 [Pseudonocardiales bacterium]